MMYKRCSRRGKSLEWRKMCDTINKFARGLLDSLSGCSLFESSMTVADLKYDHHQLAMQRTSL